MSKETRREQLGKVLACLLVCKKGRCTIKDLEREYAATEGRQIPYQEFGNISSVDFFRSIKTHVRLVQECGNYYVFPVVSDKLKHVKDLVSKTPNRRKSSRPTRCYPAVRPLRPYVPHTVQKSVAQILRTNPSGVDKGCIAECLQNSNAIAGTVDSNNVDEFVSGMPHTAVSSGNRIYPSRSLGERSRSAQRDREDINGFEVVSPRDSQTQNPLTSYNNCCPAGSEDGGEFYVEEGYDEENCHNGTGYRDKEPEKRSTENRGRVSSAEFINRAAGFRNAEEPRDSARESDNRGQDLAGREIEQIFEVEEGNCVADYTYLSDEDISVDIIGSRLKKRLQDLIKKHPDGIWCADLLQAYLDEYNFSLDYNDYGFPSVCEFASRLEDVFHVDRLSTRGDFKLYDASKPIPVAPSKPEPYLTNDAWKQESDDDDDDMVPFPTQLARQASQKLVPNDVVAQAESVGQVTIPDVSEGTDYLEIYVSEVYTPSLFWIHLRKKRPRLEQLMGSMHEFYEREGHRYTIPTVILEKGLNCVCTFQDKWHRAIIKTVQPNGDVTLIFYDYGTTKTYPSESLRYLTRTYSNLPAQAIACGLYNVKPIDSTLWTRGTSSEFWNKVEGLALIAFVMKVDRESNSMLVSLVDTRGEVDLHINDWLVYKGFAEHGKLGDSVDLEFQYFEDLPTAQAQDITTTPTNVPLVLPQSTLPDNIGTLRPPPGFTKPFEPTNYAAIMDNCLQAGSFSTTEMTNTPLSNLCNINVNNNPLAPASTLYNPLALSPKALVQFWKQRLEMDMQLAAAMNQFLSNNNVSTAISSDMSSIDSLTPSINSTVQKSSSNPFQSYQEQELSTTMNGLEESTDCLTNLSTNEFNTCNFLSSTTLPQSEEKRHLISTDSNPLELDQKILREPTDRDIEELGMRLHDTNPFKEHIIERLSSPVETNNNTLKGPPIPPRKLDMINKSVNFTNKPDVKPSPKIYYNSDPVMYNLRSNDTDNKSSEETPKSTSAVSFACNKDYIIINSSQEITNQSINKNTILDFGKTNSSEVRTQDSFTPGLYPNHQIFTPSRNFSANDTQFLRPGILTSSYRPPPPPYNGNSSTKHQYKNKSSISPRYPSPLSSKNSETAIADSVSATLDFFDKLESVGTTSQGLKTRDEIFRIFGSFDNHTSSSSTTNKVTSPSTRSESTFDSQNVSEPKKEYKIKLIIPKSLQGQESTINAEQELPDNLHQTKVLNKASGITPRFEKTTQNFSKEERSFPATSQSASTLPWSMGDQESHNLRGDVSKDSGKPQGCVNPFIQANEEGDTRNKEKSSSPLPTPSSRQTSVNQQRLVKSEIDNSRMRYNGEITTNINHLGFSNTTEPMSMHRSPISVAHPCQPQPMHMPQHYLPLYPQPGHLPPYPNYPYQMSPEIIPRPQFHPGMPLLRPNGGGCFATLPPWIRPQLFNAAYAQYAQYAHTTSHVSQPLSNRNFWNHNPIFAPKQTAGVGHRTAAPNMQCNSKVDFNKESLPSEKENVSVLQNKQMGIDRADLTQSTGGLTASIPPQLNQSNLHSANGNIAANGAENSEEEDTSSLAESSRGKTQTVAELTTSSSEDSMNEIFNSFSEDVPTRAMNIFKSVEVKKQTVFLFNIENQGWVCTDEIVQVFIPSETRNTILRMLEMMNTKIDFKEITRAQRPDLFAQLDNTSLRLPRMTNSRKIRGPLHLTPVGSLCQMMNSLGVISDDHIGRLSLQKKLPPGSNLVELATLVAAYRSNDEYWA